MEVGKKRVIAIDGYTHKVNKIDKPFVYKV
jgi:hypothetical protein